MQMEAQIDQTCVPANWSGTAAVGCVLPTCLQDKELELKTLKADVLQQVAAMLPQKERLGSFSLTSPSMHAAAVAATDDIELSFFHYRDSFCSYMYRHGGAVQHFSIEESGDLEGKDLLIMMPWQSMAQLHSLSYFGGVPISTQSTTTQRTC
jgi:hypothetical protein